MPGLARRMSAASRRRRWRFPFDPCGRPESPPPPLALLPADPAGDAAGSADECLDPTASERPEETGASVPGARVMPSGCDGNGLFRKVWITTAVSTSAVVLPLWPRT